MLTAAQSINAYCLVKQLYSKIKFLLYHLLSARVVRGNIFERDLLRLIRIKLNLIRLSWPLNSLSLESCCLQTLICILLLSLFYLPCLLLLLKS